MVLDELGHAQAVPYVPLEGQKVGIDLKARSETQIEPDQVYGYEKELLPATHGISFGALGF
jgi:hypothetical protein